MDVVNQPITMVQTTLTSLLTTVVNFVPSFVWALIMLLIGRIIARLIKKWVIALANMINADGLMAKAWLSGFISKLWFGGIGNIFGNLLYWIIFLWFLTSFFNALQLNMISQLINNLVNYMPNLIVAVLLLIVGMYFADFIKKLINGISTASDSQAGTLPGNVAYYVVLVTVAMTALAQAKIDISFLTNNVTLIVAGLMLAVGLWWQHKAKELIEKYIK